MRVVVAVFHQQRGGVCLVLIEKREKSVYAFALFTQQLEYLVETKIDVVSVFLSARKQKTCECVFKTKFIYISVEIKRITVVVA